MTSVSESTPNKMLYTPEVGLAEIGAFDKTMKATAEDLARPALPAQSSATRPVPPEQAKQLPTFKSAEGGQTLSVPSREEYEVRNPKKPDDVTTRVLYQGHMLALPTVLQEQMPAFLLRVNKDPEYTAENTRKRFEQPGKEMFAVTERQQDGTEKLIGIGAAARGHGIEHDGTVQNILYEQHLAGEKGGGTDVKKARIAFAENIGSHLFFISAFPTNELPGAAQSRQKGQLNWSAPTHIEEAITRGAFNEKLRTECCQAYGLPHDTPLDVLPPDASAMHRAAVDTYAAFLKPIVVAKAPYHDVLGHESEHVRAQLFPAMAGKTWDATPDARPTSLSNEEKATWTAAAKAFGMQVGQDGSLQPRFHVDGTQVSQTPALGWLLNVIRDKSGEVVTANHPIGTEMQMGRIMQNGPHKEVEPTEENAHNTELPRIPAHYYTNQGTPSNSMTTLSLEMVAGPRLDPAHGFRRNGVPPSPTPALIADTLARAGIASVSPQLGLAALTGATKLGLAYEAVQHEPRAAQPYSLSGSEVPHPVDDTRPPPKPTNGTVA